MARSSTRVRFARWLHFAPFPCREPAMSRPERGKGPRGGGCAIGVARAGNDAIKPPCSLTLFVTLFVTLL